MKRFLDYAILAILLQLAVCSSFAQIRKLTPVSPINKDLNSARILSAEKRLVWEAPKFEIQVPKNIETKLKKSRVFQIETKSDGGVDLGGGVIVNINNRPALRDLVDKTTCQWMTARDFQEKFVPGTKSVIEKIKEVHWYLADAYQREIQDMLICLTSGPLKKIPDQDLDAVTIFPHETLQAAIRAGRLVFLDMNIFANMINQLHREFLFIHEVTHSFIPFDRYSVEKRNDSLRSFVKMLSTDFDANVLATNIVANQLSVPTTSAPLESYRNEVLDVFNVATPLSKRAQLATQLAKILDAHLWVTDRRQLSNIVQSYTELSDQIWGAISREDHRLIEYLYKQNNIETGAQLFLAFANRCYYYPTALQVALYKCGSQPPEERFQFKVVEFFINKMGHKATVDEIKFFIARTMRVIPKTHSWFYLGQKNPQYEEVEKTAQILIWSVPADQLKDLSKDSVIQSSDLFLELIRKRLSVKQ